MTLDEDMAPTVAAREVGLFFGKEPGKEEEKEAPADPWLANGPPPKWQKQDSHRGKGHQQQWWNPTSAKRGWESAQTYSSDIQPMDSQTVEFLKALTKLSLKHEDELRRQRPDQDFMAFFDVGPHGFLETMKAAAEEWATQYDQGKVKSALRHIMFLGVIRELKLRLHAAISDEVKSARYRTMHWTVEGPTPQNPAWNYFRWNPSRFVGGAGPAIPPGRHGTAGAAGEALHGGQQPDQVRFHQEHGGAVRVGRPPVPDLHRHAQCLLGPLPQRADEAHGQRGVEGHGLKSAPGQGRQTTLRESFGTGLPQHAFLRLAAEAPRSSTGRALQGRR